MLWEGRVNGYVTPNSCACQKWQLQGTDHSSMLMLFHLRSLSTQKGEEAVLNQR